MKRLFSLLLSASLLLALTACGGQAAGSNESTAAEAAPQAEKQTDTLVVYFSPTGHTKSVAEKIAELTEADIYEIVPAEPYTRDDLDYNVSDCRANLEMNDPAARPAIAGDRIDITGYKTIILGYPIWWGTMPRIINTFIETYDLSGKAVYPFCTSGGSDVSKSVADLRTALPNIDIRDGLRARSASDSNIAAWVPQP